MSYSIDGSAFAADLRKLASHLHKDVHDAMQEAVKEAEHAAKTTTLFKDSARTYGLAPFGPHLRETIVGTVTSSTTGQIVAGAPHAHYIEVGTEAHWIPPGLGKLMHFEWKGVEMYRYHVWHPAVKARPFMEQAGEWGGHVLHTALTTFTSDAIVRFNS